MPGANYLSNQIKVGTFYDWVTGGVTPIGTEYVSSITSRGMPINQLNKREHGKFVAGGDWFAWEAKDYHLFNEPSVIVRAGSGSALRRAYQGQGRIKWSSATHWNAIKVGPSATVIAAMQDSMNSWGAEGWRRARPAQPDFSLAQSLYELKDIPEMLKASLYQCIKRVLKKKTWLSFDWTRKRFFDNRNKSYVRRTSEWHLAIQFGWLPILKDVVGFLETLENRDKLLAQLLRDEGKPIKRRRALDHPKDEPGVLFAPQYSATQHTTSYNANCSPTLVTQCYTSNAYPSKTEWFYTGEFKMEFVAQFRYWLPPGPRDHAYIKKLTRRLFGLRVTPSMVWAVMPWSWLADYFVDVRSVIDFVSPGVEDCLICDWAYVTRKETRKYRCKSFQNIMYTNVNGRPLYAERVYEDVIKSRVHASYFGFRVKENDLSLRQKAILLALGGSRA